MSVAGPAWFLESCGVERNAHIESILNFHSRAGARRSARRGGGVGARLGLHARAVAVDHRIAEIRILVRRGMCAFTLTGVNQFLHGGSPFENRYWETTTNESNVKNHTPIVGYLSNPFLYYFSKTA